MEALVNLFFEVMSALMNALAVKKESSVFDVTFGMFLVFMGVGSIAFYFGSSAPVTQCGSILVALGLGGAVAAWLWKLLR